MWNALPCRQSFFLGVGVLLPVYGSDCHISLYTAGFARSHCVRVGLLYAVALSEASIDQNEFALFLPCQCVSGLVTIRLV